MLSDKITSFFFLKEKKVNEKKKQMDTLKYLSIIIKICFIYLRKKNISIITFNPIALIHQKSIGPYLPNQYWIFYSSILVLFYPVSVSRNYLQDTLI